MAKHLHADVLDNGPAYVKTNCDKMLLIDEYTAGDSYATVNGNKLAEATMASGDFTLASSGNNRTMTTATKSASATAGATGANLHIAFVDTVNSKVLMVTDETTDQTITNGNTVNFPAITYTANQPT